jgi:hypothetical protein
MPIHQMLKNIFSLPNILKDVLQNMEELEKKNTISNFINGSRWKEIRRDYSDDDLVIPFDYYLDDFETGNALGSNSGTHKVTAHYISFPVFPSHLLSSTKYVFECLLYPSRLKAEELQHCQESLVIVFKDLEENGVEVEMDNETRTVFFVMGRVLGDNLGLNEILGFTKGFNANKFCRLCPIEKSDSKRKPISTEEDLRTIEDYEEEVQENDSKLTGIYDECCLNVLRNFHCTSNIVCDILHDVFEGLAKYDLAMCLQMLIKDKTLPDVTLENINILKQNFSYGRIEIGNLSKPIETNHLTNQNLRMSASESRTFLRFFPLMAGHLVPRDNKYWKLILNLVELADMMMISEFTEDHLQQLKEKIISYNSSFVKLFGAKLRPKHHFVSHYIECIKHNGPLR